MSPEQVEGREVTVRSDVYALGLVLYELFTGQVAYPARTLAEAAQRGETPPPRAVEPRGGPRPRHRAGDRALPGARPGAATADGHRRRRVAPRGRSPGRGPGRRETPPRRSWPRPGPRGGLRPGVALGCLATVVVLWFANPFPGRSINPFDHLPFVKSYEALQGERPGDRPAPRLRRAAAATPGPGSGSSSPSTSTSSSEHGPASLADDLSQPGQPVLLWATGRTTAPSRPWRSTGGWAGGAPRRTRVTCPSRVDLRGHLDALRVTPSWRDSGDEPAPETDWALLFEVAGLDIERFEPAEPTVRPESFADTRRAWTGTLPDYHDRPVRIEAAALDGRPDRILEDHLVRPALDAEGGQPPRAGDRCRSPRPACSSWSSWPWPSSAPSSPGRPQPQAGPRRSKGGLSPRRLRLHPAPAALGPGRRPRGPPGPPGPPGRRLQRGQRPGPPHVGRLRRVRALRATALARGAGLLDPGPGRAPSRSPGGTRRAGRLHVRLGPGAPRAVWAFWLAERAGIVGSIPLEESLVVMRGGRFAVGELFGVALVSVAAALAS